MAMEDDAPAAAPSDAPAAAPAAAAGLGGGTFADAWRQKEAARLAEEQKKRSLVASKEKYRMSRALHVGRLGEAIHAAEAILSVGETVSTDLMRQLVLGSADRPGAKLFAKAIMLATRAKVKFDEHSFASLIGKLLAREAPHAQVRCALNFGIRPDAEVLTLEPADGRDEEKKDAFKNPEKDDGTNAEVSDDEGDAGRHPRNLEFRGCVANNRLNGLYQLKPGDKKQLGHDMPIYEKRSGGGKMNKLSCYFYDEATASKYDAAMKTGWYIGPRVGFGQVFAKILMKRADATVPPEEGTWQVKGNTGPWQVDHPGFSKVQREKKRPLTNTEEEVERELTIIDLSAMKGSVEGKDSESCAYFSHFFVLLTLEHLTELRGFRSRWNFRKSWELVNFGLCFQDMKVDEVMRTQDESKGVTLPGWPNNGSQTVAFALPRETNSDRCRMKASESVLVSRGDPLKACICEGSVQSIDFVDRRLVVTLNGKLPDDPWGKAKYRLDVYANRTTYERQTIALLEFASGKRSTICEMLVAAQVGQVDLAVLGGDGFGAADKNKVGGSTDAKPKDESEETATRALAQLGLDNWNDDSWFMIELERRRRERGFDAEEQAIRKEKVLKLAHGDIDELDHNRLSDAAALVESMPSVSTAQKDAIGNSMAKRLTIVQGPPGTGKTHTSVRIITMWVKTMGYKPLLCTSECNIAVDNIAIGLRKNGVNVVRMGNVAKVREELEPACMGQIVKARLKKQKEDIDEESEELEEVGDEPWEKETDEWTEWNRRRLAYRRKRLWEQKQQRWLKQQIIEDAEVIAATTVNSGSAALNGIKFHGILIDEVAQATETSSIVPIVCRGAEQLVLCGDHCQLPPSVQSREAELRGFSLSLYSRLVEAGVPFRFLDTQYRAHPMLMEFSAMCIYQGKLKSGIDGSGRPSVKGVEWPNKNCPAAFFECGVEEHLEGESKANEAEAKIVLKIVQGILDAGELDTDEIGVVTPYKGQVRVLRRVLHAGLDITDEQRKGLEMASVDNFQGREKEIIIFTAVRCNDYGGVGFLKDWRRLNVMITRARRGLVIVGCAKTLCFDIHWRQWLEFTEKQGGVMPGTVQEALERGQQEAEEKAIAKGRPKGKGKGKKGKKGKGKGKDGKDKGKGEGKKNKNEGGEGQPEKKAKTA